MTRDMHMKCLLFLTWESCYTKLKRIIHNVLRDFSSINVIKKNFYTKQIIDWFYKTKWVIPGVINKALIACLIPSCMCLARWNIDSQGDDTWLRAQRCKVGSQLELWAIIRRQSCQARWMKSLEWFLFASINNIELSDVVNSPNVLSEIIDLLPTQH